MKIDPLRRFCRQPRALPGKSRTRGRPFRRRACGLTAIVLLAACGWGCRDQKPADRPNVILILVDTLRADRLGAYGYERATSPSFDGLASSAVLFENARSQASCTFPSVNSLFTSRHAVRFLGQPERRLGIPAGVDSLAEILTAGGYQSAAISASPIVRKTPSKHNPHGGFERGFAFFDESCLWREAACVRERAAEWLTSAPAPFFLYLHFMDPHGPYNPPPSHARRFAGPYDGPEFIQRGNPTPIAHALHGTGPQIAWTPADVAHLSDLYDEEVAYFDAQLGLLIESLRSRGLLERSLLVLVSDHGEEFLEHGEIKHCRGLWDTVVRTPMLLRLPGGPGGERIAAPVGNLDLVPTVLDYLAVGVEGRGLEGRSLRPLIERRTDRSGQVFSSQGPLRSAADPRFKLIYEMGKSRFELFDLLADPGERSDLAPTNLEELRRLRKELFTWLLAVEGSVDSPQSLRAADEVEAQLRALGYL